MFAEVKQISNEREKKIKFAVHLEKNHSNK